jgi:polysaccharide biosynthesis/export protein
MHFSKKSRVLSCKNHALLPAPFPNAPMTPSTPPPNRTVRRWPPLASIGRVLAGALVASLSMGLAVGFLGGLVAHESVEISARHDPTIQTASIPKASIQTTPAPVIQLCQAYGPAPCGPDCIPYCPDGRRPLTGVHDPCPGCGELGWGDSRLLPWQAFGQGEYVGPPRCEHVPLYRLRVDDVIDNVYRLTREELSHPYRLEVGDVIQIESVNNPEISREVQVQPDGNITLLLIGTVRAVRRTIPELTAELEERYLDVLRRPSLTVTPVRIQTRLEDLRNAVDNRFFAGGQGRQARVLPDGTIHLPAIGEVPAQGLTLQELKLEIEERYRIIVSGLEVTPILIERAPRFVYVAGEVRVPGRYTLEQPTTTMMAIALAGGANNGGNLREIVVFRRTEDWKLMATRIDLNGALLGKRPSPADEIWLRDSDIVLVPKNPLLRSADLAELLFTRNLYAVVPAQTFFTQKTQFVGQ